MKKLQIIIILFSFILNAQNEKLQREAFVLNLTEENGNLYKKEIPKSSYLIENNTLEIYPTERLNIEVVIKSDTIYSLKIVNKINQPKKTITIDFYQDVKKMETKMVIRNPFKKWKLKYDAEVYLLKREKWVDAEIWEIEPKKAVAEIWRNTMSAARLKNWKLIKI
jgi:hypothetical protein